MSKNRMRSAIELISALLLDLLKGKRNWWNVQQWVESVPELKKLYRKDPQNFGDEGHWKLPPRDSWVKQPFSKERFPEFKLVFFHINKTAGMSFSRSLMESDLGKGHCFLSAVSVLKILWKQLDLLYPELNNDEKMVGFLNGLAQGLPRSMTTLQSHDFFHPRVMEAFKSRDDVMKIMWLRQPNRLVLSLFNFRKDQIRNSIQDWSINHLQTDRLFKDVMEVLAFKEWQNLMTQRLRGLRLEDFDFVGITEHFESDLAFLDQRLGNVGLKAKHQNRSTSSRPLELEEEKRLAEWNSEDWELYRRALEMRQSRLSD